MAASYHENVIAEQRVIVPELLDNAGPADATEVLKDLARVNRYFGGYRILRKIIGPLASRREPFTLLDVGAASGDTGAMLRGRYPHATVVSFDRQGFHLAAAPQPKIVGDAFQLPFRAASFDFVFCSLFLHHFTDEQVVALLGDFKRLARRAVLAIDLERGPLAFRFLPATQWLFGWHKMFVSDGLLSVQAAFKKRELLALARRAGLERARVSTHRPWGRLSLVASVQP
ncbi:MAG TPA: methyltransferase domain-containing protein [Bryobacteraceae bacterium]|nr:methyltransferase domain-containing protein [Bryobacteraceae bacterium]